MAPNIFKAIDNTRFMNFVFMFIREDHLIILDNDVIRLLVVVINYLRVSGINS